LDVLWLPASKPGLLAVTKLETLLVTIRWPNLVLTVALDCLAPLQQDFCLAAAFLR
jgi:hypothetical protein